MADSNTEEMGKLAIAIAAFVVLGIPLLAYVWETFNRLFSGHLDTQRALITLPAILLLIALLVVLARTLNRLEGERRT